MKRFLLSFSALALLLTLTPPTAEAQRRGGILGRAAPQLQAGSWFNLPKGETAFDVAKHKGKVIYMLFFQSW